jgi:hypothetical protein
VVLQARIDRPPTVETGIYRDHDRRGMRRRPAPSGQQSSALSIPAGHAA